ncbi:MAG: hypothetical protein NXI31_19945 [bacterium]|nr:hypothetical protein [bacterium]
MTYSILAAVVLACATTAQSLQLTTANVNPSSYANAAWSGWYFTALPRGPVTPPVSLGFLGPRLVIDQQANTLSARASGIAGQHWRAYVSVTSDLVTTVTSPTPARIELQILNTLNFSQSLTTAVPRVDLGVDVLADGTDEFSVIDTSSTLPIYATIPVHCDSRGTAVRWHHLTSAGTNGGFGATLSVTNQFSLQFPEPIPEPSYGPSCAGELGCQRGAGTFDRTFVASLPDNTTFAWLMGGDRALNVQFSGIPCPLLVEPQFVVAVPLTAGANDRQFADFDGTFPPIPGLTFYAQAIAVSNGRWIGTNGVRVAL